MLFERNKENQNIEWKINWKDEHLKCVCAFANTDGGEIFIGFEDKTGNLVGVDNADRLVLDIPKKIISILGIVSSVEMFKEDGKRYVKISVNKYTFPISYHGKYYLRSGSNTFEVTGVELNEFMLRKLGRTWDSIPYPDITINDLSKDAIKIFREKALRSKRLTKEELDVDDKTLLQNLQLYDNEYLIVASVLLFHEHPERLITAPIIKLGFFEDDSADLRFQDEISGPLISQSDRAIEILYTKYLKAVISYDDLQRDEDFMFPREAFRELLLNSINHKDYGRGIPIQVRVYEDRINIFNNGSFPKQIDPKKVYEEHSSFPYNPKIAMTLFKAGLIESWGRGFEKIKKECTTNDTPNPILDVTEDGVTVKCLPSKKYRIGFKDTIFNPKYRIISYLEKYKKITTNEAMKVIQLAATRTKTILNEMVEKKVLTSIGSNRNRYYELFKTGDKL